MPNKPMKSMKAMLPMKAMEPMLPMKPMKRTAYEAQQAGPPEKSRDLRAAKRPVRAPSKADAAPLKSGRRAGAKRRLGR
jgi:hypothetical protein